MPRNGVSLAAFMVHSLQWRPRLIRRLAEPGPGREHATQPYPFQVVLGTLVNAILNDPGPLSLHDREMEVRLSSCLLQLLEAEMKATSSKASVRNSVSRRK